MADQTAGARLDQGLAAARDQKERAKSIIAQYPGRVLLAIVILLIIVISLAIWLGVIGKKSGYGGYRAHPAPYYGYGFMGGLNAGEGGPMETNSAWNDPSLLVEDPGQLGNDSLGRPYHKQVPYYHQYDLPHPMYPNDVSRYGMQMASSMPPYAPPMAPMFMPSRPDCPCPPDFSRAACAEMKSLAALGETSVCHLPQTTFALQ